MKFIILLFIICLSLYTKSAYACSGPPAPFFEIPSYIDYDYKPPSYSEVSYGQKTKFNLLLEKYKNTGQPQDNVKDAAARAASEKQEPDNYFQYLKGAEKFNAQEYEHALKIFIELKNSPSSVKEKLLGLFKYNKYSWAKEASSYMIARCQLIMAQKNWDGYSNPTADVDQNMLQEAASSYQRYIKEYPQGLYTNSARNIHRKISYLSGNQAELDKELRRIMLEAFPISPTTQAPHNTRSNMVNEFLNYFRGEIDIARDSPVLVAYAWLGGQKPKDEEIAALEAREKDFAPYPGLLRYVRALGLYRLERYQELLDKTSEEKLIKNTLSLSTQLLRARSLFQVKKTDEALRALKKMHEVSPEDSIELEIAYLKLNSGNGLWLYTNESPLKTEKNLRSLAQFGLTDDELEKGIESKDIIGDKRKFLVDELARRYVLSKRFKKLSSLLAKEQGTGIFIPLKSAIAALVENANNEQALVDVGEFLYQHYITPSATFEGYNSNRWGGNALTDLSTRCKPCEGFKERSKSYVPPITFFRSVTEIAQHSGKKSEAEAKALHYIVRCGRQGGEFEERCTWRITWERQSDGSSKAAFMRLHKIYKESPWTVKTRYYY